MAFNISYVYEIINKASGPLKKIAEAQTTVARGAAKAATVARRFGAALEKLRQKASAASSKMRSLGGSLTLKVTAPLGVLAGMALKSSANLETLQTSFESMLGSADKARDTVKQLVDFTARTPFQLEGVGKSAKQLLAFGVASKDLLPTLSVLGDISAGANVPLTEMAAIFGKIKAKGKAYTEELLQMSDRGIPIIDLLAKKFGVTKQAVFDAASKGKISFKIIEDAMRDMTSQGGIFVKQMERQSGTLAGLFSTLKDNIVLALAEVGDVLVENLDLKNLMKDVIGNIQVATRAFAEFTKNNPKLTKFGLIIVGLVSILGPFIAFIGFMVAGFALLAGPVLLAVVAFAALSAGVVALLVFKDDVIAFFSGITDAAVTAAVGAFAALSAGVATLLVFKDDVIAFFSGVADAAVAAAAPVVAIWDDITASISGAMSTVASGIQTVKSFFGGDEESRVRAPGSQELNGRLGIDINLTGNTGAVESASARPIGGGNLGMNMAFAQ